MAIILVVGLFLFHSTYSERSEPPPIPAAVITEPTLESLARFDFEPPMWGMPDATAWTHMEAGLLEVEPGASFTTDGGWYTSVDGPLVLGVLSGKLEITPVGPAYFYAASHRTAPTEISSGATITLEPNDVIVYSSADTATGRNSGTEPVLALYGIGGTLDETVPGSQSQPKEISAFGFDVTDWIPPILSKGATVSLQRLELQPASSFVFDPNTEWRFIAPPTPVELDGVRLYSGAVTELSPDLGYRTLFNPMQLRHLLSRPHTIVNLGEKTVALYFFVIESLPVAGTPSA